MTFKRSLLEAWVESQIGRKRREPSPCLGKGGSPIPGSSGTLACAQGFHASGFVHDMVRFLNL